MAGTHAVGYCKLVIEDTKGNVVRDDEELFVISRSGCPRAGDWLTVPSVGRYFVDRVEFVPEEGTRTRDFVYPVLHLRPPGSRKTTSPDDRSRGPTPLPKGGQATRNVLPIDSLIAIDTGRLDAVILPANLVANLVTVGYRAQATELDDERRALAASMLCDDARLRIAMTDVLNTLSREAKSHAVQCQLVFAGSTVRDTDAVPVNEPSATKKPTLVLIRGGADSWSIDAA